MNTHSGEKGMSMQPMSEMLCMEEFSVPVYDVSHRGENTSMQSVSILVS